MKAFLKITFIIFLSIQIQCRTLMEIGNGKLYPYSGTTKNWKCILAKVDEENQSLNQIQKLFCIIDFPMTFAFDIVFLFITIPAALKSSDEDE